MGIPAMYFNGIAIPRRIRKEIPSRSEANRKRSISEFFKSRLMDRAEPHLQTYLMQASLTLMGQSGKAKPKRNIAIYKTLLFPVVS
jgi:hypothetical protein